PKQRAPRSHANGRDNEASPSAHHLAPSSWRPAGPGAENGGLAQRLTSDGGGAGRILHRVGFPRTSVRRKGQHVGDRWLGYVRAGRALGLAGTWITPDGKADARHPRTNPPSIG